MSVTSVEFSKIGVQLPKLEVLGSTIAYREAGDREAPLALFLHGNLTSSYI